MNWLRRIRPPSSRTTAEGGFTLVELLITLVVLSFIAGALGAAFTTAMTASTNNSQMVHASNDAQLIAAYLVRDGQSAGGTNPITGLVDGSLGVSVNWIAENAGTDPDPAVCSEANPDQLLMRFAWRDNVDADLGNSQLHLAKYYFVPATASADGQIVRLTCVDSTRESELTLGTRIGGPAPVATCVASSDCPGLPGLVQLTVHEVPNALTPATPYVYTLTANVRPSDDAPALGSANAATVPLLALGDGNCSHGASYAQGGNGTAQIFGGVAVSETACDPFNFFGSYSYTVAGDPQQAPILDPYRFLPTPPGTCPVSGGTNPGLDASGEYPPGVYPQSLPANAALEPGVFVLCDDVPTGLTGTGVMLYLARGQLHWNGGASLTNLTAPSTGPYAGVAIWQPQQNTADLSINGGAALTLGLAAPGIGSGIYAPKALVDLSGTANISVGWIVAQSVLIEGNHTVTVGVPPATLPGIDPAPASLPIGLVGQPYPSTQITASGGAGGNTWTDKDPATGTHTLPTGLTINGSGVISGTPTAPCACTAVITVMDNLGDVSRKAYPLTVNAPPTVTSVSPSFRAQGATSQNVTINGSSFATGAVASFSGTGITVNTTTWVSSATLSANITIAGNAPTGLRDVTVTNPDSGADTASNAFSVNAAPTITSVTLGNGGGTPGTIDQGDTVTVVFSTQMSVASFCSTWSNDANNQSLTANNDVMVSVGDGGIGTDALSVSSGSCGVLNFQLGSIDLGATGYVTGGATASFVGSAGNKSTVSWTANTRTLVIKLGAMSAGTVANVPSSTPVYTASGAITDSGGGPLSNSPATLPAGRQF